MKPNVIYSKRSVPGYLCPSCANGSIVPDTENAISRQTGESFLLAKLDYWEPCFHKELLRVDLSCSNKECNEVGVMILQGELYPPDEHQPQAEVLYTPIYINPAPQLFRLADEYPASIKELLKEAFTLFWIDSASCGNKIRVGVEALLSEQKVEKNQKDKNGIAILGKKGRPKPITLQKRLKLFETVSPSSAAALESIKWLGNQSSHYGINIHQDLLYNGVMIFGAVLAHLYKNMPLVQEIDYSIDEINFWYHPDEQAAFPKEK